MKQEDQQSWIEEFDKRYGNKEMRIFDPIVKDFMGKDIKSFISITHQHLLQQVLQKKYRMRNFSDDDTLDAVDVEDIQAVFQSFGSKI